jgi:uncharacterized metal-binding protein
MPGGKTHDAITILLVLPTFSATYIATKSVAISAILMCGMLFGGLMFGPDLDIKSTQQNRWGIFSFLWLPYRWCFKHRSRWSHGLIFGSLFRVVYFFGIITLVAFICVYAYVTYAGGDVPDLIGLSKNWTAIGEFLRSKSSENVFMNLFIGIWIGAASHTFTDMAGSFVKTGRVMEFL